MEERGVEGLIPERQRPEENPASDPARQPVAEMGSQATAEAPASPSGAAPGAQAQAEAGVASQAGAPREVHAGAGAALLKPVPAEQWDKLPINPQHKVLDKAAFIYDPVADRYVCPMGQALEFRGTDKYERQSGGGEYRVYECSAQACGACPLAKRCIKGKTKARRVMRDEYQGARDRGAQRMESPQGKEDYRRRWWIAETPFGILKTVMDFRRLLLRGRERVGTELHWMGTAFNLRKLVRLGVASRMPAAEACVT